MPRLIFVVDDERVIADTLCVILRQSGYDAVAFYDAESALRQCEDLPPEFVISDVSMPGMNGVELAVQIKEHLPGCRVLLFSGHAGTSEVIEAAHKRGYDFELLEKPVHPKNLLDRLESSNPIATSVNLMVIPESAEGTRIRGGSEQRNM